MGCRLPLSLAPISETAVRHSCRLTRRLDSLQAEPGNALHPLPYNAQLLCLAEDSSDSLHSTTVQLDSCAIEWCGTMPRSVVESA